MPTFLLKRGGWPFVHKIMSALGCVGLVLVLASNAVGQLEGRVFPVAEHFVITSSEAVSDALGEGTLVYGTFDLLRGGCTFSEIDWSLIGARRSAPVSVTFLPGTRVRDLGLNEYGPWRLSITPDRLHDTRVEAYHDCRWRPWRVKTYLWP